LYSDEVSPSERSEVHQQKSHQGPKLNCFEAMTVQVTGAILHQQPHSSAAATSVFHAQVALHGKQAHPASPKAHPFAAKARVVCCHALSSIDQHTL
jgi:hypothetical protein